MIGDLVRRLDNPTQADLAKLAQALEDIERRSDVLAGWIAPGGSYPVIAYGEFGRLKITEQLLIDDGAPAISLESDGDAFFGSDISAPATTSLAIFSNAQTYNSEARAAGDVLFGDNTTGKANMLWDAFYGVIRFRGGTTTQAYVDTDGTIAWAGGRGKLTASGMQMDGTRSTYDDGQQIEWLGENDTEGRPYGRLTFTEAYLGGRIASIAYAPDPAGTAWNDMYCYQDNGLDYHGGCFRVGPKTFEWEFEPAQGADFPVLRIEQTSTLYIAKSTTTFNPDGIDADVQFMGSGSNAYLLFLDGGDGEVSIGTYTKGAIAKFESSPGIIFNDEGSSYMDFRVEGDTDTHLLFVDAGRDKVGIGDNAPGEKLDVAGNINATGVIKIDDLQVVGNRVIDERCDDTINESTWDSTTAGVLDALRDAMREHGLIAAASPQTYQQSAAGALTSAGSLANKTKKPLAGTLTSDGDVGEPQINP